MWTYQHTDELYHHGVKGMRWGVRRYQNADGSLTPAGKKRYDKLDRRLQRTISSNEKADNKILDARARNRSKYEAKYDKKIAKAEERGKINKRDRLLGRKNDVLDDFDSDTASIKKAMVIGQENRTNIMKLKMQAISDPSIKESESYRKAKKWASSQAFSEAYYGRNYTLLMEANRVQVDKGRSWTRGKLD